MKQLIPEIHHGAERTTVTYLGANGNTIVAEFTGIKHAGRAKDYAEALGLFLQTPYARLAEIVRVGLAVLTGEETDYLTVRVLGGTDATQTGAGSESPQTSSDHPAEC